MKISLGAFYLVTMIFRASPSIAQSADHKEFSFKVYVQDLHGASGHAFSYYVTQDSLRIMAFCEDVGCDEKVIYKQRLTERTAVRFAAFISDLKLDTLRSRYYTMALCGLTRAITFQLNNGETKHIVLHNFYHPTIARLVFEIEQLIADEKFKNLR